MPYGERERGLWVRGFHEPEQTIALIIFALISLTRTQSCGYIYAWGGWGMKFNYVPMRKRK